MSQYEAVESEKKWQQKWKEWEIYKFDPCSPKPVFSIDNPPRYTSGSLHLGHATGYSLIDFAARYKRMRGHNVFFPLCFDVNGTPTEIKVEKKHGITKLNTPRQEYVRLCSEFANSFIDEMTKQFEMLGESMDPTIYYQTDAPYYRRITQITFLRLLEKGIVYKGTFPVNWCPSCTTALADAEVEYSENITKLNYIKFKIKGTDEDVLIATTRPELLSACQLVAVSPEDESKADLVGKELITPIYGKAIKVIADDKVDPSYGTGVVMICTIGDKTDLEWVMKYNLPMDRAIDEQGRLTSLTGKYEGMTVKEGKQAIIEDLKASGLLVRQEDTKQNVGGCWRCHHPIEYLQMPQWFLKTMDYKDQILKLADEVEWHPGFMKVRLQDWVNSLQWDWVISRQRYFATPIPVWECEECGKVVPAEESQCYVDPTVDRPPVDECPDCGGRLVGCTDVFDTWMDSSISALYNTFWERDDEKFKRLYPMSMRPQSHDIIRTWAFYSLLRCYLMTGERPWDHIMIHGFIMAPDGTPMHSSIGNVIDPLPILEEYGADAMRYYACTCALGEDNAFREKDVIHGKRLCNKLWNIGKFTGMVVKEKPEMKGIQPMDRWILSKFSRVVRNATAYYEAYQFDRAMREIEDFAWHEYADHYLEMVKHRTREGDDGVRFTLYTVTLGIAKMLAPLMPHVTEDIYQENFLNLDGARSIHVSSWPEEVLISEEDEKKGDLIKEVISSIRAWKAEKGFPLNREIELIELIGPSAMELKGYESDIVETSRAKSLKMVVEADLEDEVVALKPIKSAIGPTFKQKGKEIMDLLASLDPAQAGPAVEKGELTLTLGDGSSVTLDKRYVEVQRKLTLEGKAVDTLQVRDILIAVSP
ncbi:MAG TPA: valine--tRNA ligase [Methanomassiliicoccaceae archaeon]|nr:valine--tRNA ligase [Methanomassiliicoccaceae archaeon]HQA20806.1 valine--tRNA ligase [Methanomassiliicoccaceae archaeon]